ARGSETKASSAIRNVSARLTLINRQVTIIQRQRKQATRRRKRRSKLAIPTSVNILAGGERFDISQIPIAPILRSRVKKRLRYVIQIVFAITHLLRSALQIFKRVLINRVVLFLRERIHQTGNRRARAVRSCVGRVT